jgi:hypothetical protein
MDDDEDVVMNDVLLSSASGLTEPMEHLDILVNDDDILKQFETLFHTSGRNVAMNFILKRCIDDTDSTLKDEWNERADKVNEFLTNNTGKLSSYFRRCKHFDC